MMIIMAHNMIQPVSHEIIIGFSVSSPVSWCVSKFSGYPNVCPLQQEKRRSDIAPDMTKVGKRDPRVSPSNIA